MSTVPSTAPDSQWAPAHAPGSALRYIRPHLPLVLYVGTVLLTCLWVLSLPIFPAQDEPLHLYYVQIFRQLLLHQHTTYTHTYAIRHLLPPYATYYYGLVGLNQFVSLETADKLFAAVNIALLATAGWVLLRSLGVTSRWVAFLFLPLLLNWPLFMGFSNFLLSLNLALFALACWNRATTHPGLRYTVGFLALIALMLITHPVPWAFTIGFAGLEVLVRLIQGRTGQRATQHISLRRDLLALAIASLSYLYLIPFRAKTQVITRIAFDKKQHAWVTLPGSVPTLARMHGQALSLLHAKGIDLFNGFGLAHLDRVGFTFLLVGTFVLALWALVLRRSRPWQLADTWCVYAIFLGLSLIVVPDSGAGGYFLVTRMQVPFYLCCVAAAAPALARHRRLALPLACFSLLFALFHLFLAQRVIPPVARTIVSLRSIPAGATFGRPGFLMRSIGTDHPADLNFDAYNWASVHYLRWHNLLLFNTPWLGDKLIPISPRPQSLPLVDETFFNQAPMYGDRPLMNEVVAQHTLNRVGLILLEKDAFTPHQNPFAEIDGSTDPAPFARPWSCTTTSTSPWYFCQRSPRNGRPETHLVAGR